MSITFLLLVHDDPQAVARLIKRLQAPGHCFVVHVDRRVSLTPFRQALPDSADVLLLDDTRRVACHWAGWSPVAAMLLLLASAQKTFPADWYQFLSGADYPLQGATSMASYYADGHARITVWREATTDARTPWRARRRVHGWNFHDQFWLNKRDLSGLPWLVRVPAQLLAGVVKAFLYVLPLRRAPAGVRIFRGSTWLALSARQAEAVLVWLAGAEGKAVSAFLAHTAAPDELFFPTALRHLDCMDGMVDAAQAGVRHAPHWIDWRNARTPALMDDEAVAQALASGLMFCRKLPPATTPDGVRLRDRIDRHIQRGQSA